MCLDLLLKDLTLDLVLLAEPFFGSEGFSIVDQLEEVAAVAVAEMFLCFPTNCDLGQWNCQASDPW